MLLVRLCSTTLATRNQSLLKLSSVTRPNLSKIQDVKLFSKKDALHQLNETNDSKKDEKFNESAIILHKVYKNMLTIELALSHFGENAKLCRYDRSSPNKDNDSISKTDKEYHNLHYNIWKNIMEFSVHPNLSQVKQVMGKLDFDDDKFCSSAADFIIRMITKTPEPEFKYNKIKFSMDQKE